MGKIKSILSGIILLVTFILVILLFLAKVAGETPQLFGYQILRISSQSMEPKLMVGDIILSKNIDDISSVHTGDIVTYIGETDDYAGKRITHEVVVEPYETDGEFLLQTQGTANDMPDPIIRASSLEGSMVCKLGILSMIYSIFITPWGLVIILGILAVLFINEVFALRQLIKENDDEEETVENNFTSVDANKKADH